MKKKLIVNPITLKGFEVNERIKELMGIKVINEDTHKSVVELTKFGPDGKVYAIVRENHEYYIKITDKTSNIIVEDFNYIGGLQNKKSEAYPSYAKAIKHLNLKFNSLNEALGKDYRINIFENDNVIMIEKGTDNEADNLSGAANVEDGSHPIWMSDSEKIENKTIDIVGDDINLSENEKAIDAMLKDDNVEDEVEIKEHRLSIVKALTEMDSIIETIERKKKAHTVV